jgi:tetratricopeptide (TPR) repeat protein
LSADECEKKEFQGDRVWVDVLIVCQFLIGSSGQVVMTTSLNYSDGKVLVLLDDEYLHRAWCLLEAAHYCRSLLCRLFVVGACKFIQGSNFFREMKAGQEEDIPLIQNQIITDFQSEQNFNDTIERAIVLLSGESLMHQARYADALAVFEQDKATAGDDNERLAKSLCDIGRAFQKLGQFSDAVKVFGESLNLLIKYHGKNHVSVSTTEKHLGGVHLSLGNYDLANDHLNAALQIQQTLPGDNREIIADTKNIQALVLGALGKFNEALAMHQEVLEIKISCLGNSCVSVAATYGNMGNVYERLGDLQKALEMHEKCLEIELKCLGNSHVSVANTKYNIAIIYRKQNQISKAKLLFSEAGDVYEAVYGADHSETIDAREQQSGD